jgi:putative membrane protein
MGPQAAHNTRHAALLACAAAGLVWSGIAPADRLTWLLEVAPVILGGAILVATHRRFPLSELAYVLIAIQAAMLLVGGHWTYAEMPLFNWLRDTLGLARNHYDRVGHFAQGFVPAIVIRELLLRTSPLRRGKWLAAITVAACLGLSAAYELIEWCAALALGQAADQFLGTQGDVWDTQWDMFMALVGAAAALLLLSRRHDRSLARLGERVRG